MIAVHVRRTVFGALVAASLLSTHLLAEDVPSAAEKFTRQLGSPQVGERREAAYQLGKMGAPAAAAVPALVKALDDQDKQVWSFAIAALAELGPEARVAIPALIESLGRRSGGRRDRERNQRMVRTAYALTRIGSEAIAPLMVALAGEDSAARAGAARALGGMGPQAGAAIPALVTNLGDGEDFVRREAIDALALIGPAAVGPVGEALAGKQSLMRASAALTLAGLGTAAKDSAPALREMFARETDGSVRAAALTALVKVSPDPAQDLPLVIAAITHEDEQLRRAAINALGSTRVLRRPAAAPLAALLPSENLAVRQWAAHALGRLGPDAAEALPGLIAAARTANGDAVYADALAQIGPAALPALLAALKDTPAPADAWILRTLRGFGPPAVPVLVEALQHTNPATRISAATALAAMGRDAAPAAAPLFTLAEVGEPGTQVAALRALVAISADRGRLKPLLVAGLGAAVPELRTASAAGLAALGETTALSLDGLIVLLSDEVPASRLVAVQALGQLGEKAAPAVPALVAKLGEPALQLSIIEALGKIGKASAPAVPQILETVQKGGAEVRGTAFTAFAGIGHAAAPALPLLYASLNDGAPEVRNPALPALISVEADDAKLLPVLIAAVNEESGRMRRPAAQALPRFGERARAAVPGLISMLERENERPLALEALRKIGVRSVPDLLRVLVVKDPRVRVFACESLAALGSEAREATQRLRDLLSGSPQAVQDAARAALAKIEPAPTL